MKSVIGEIIGKDYLVEVYNSTDYMEEWSFDKHAFELCGYGNLKKLRHF